MTTKTSQSSVKPMHPSTTNVVYTSRQVAYLQAVEDFKHRHGRKFLSACEYLQIADALGSPELN